MIQLTINIPALWRSNVNHLRFPSVLVSILSELSFPGLQIKLVSSPVFFPIPLQPSYKACIYTCWICIPLFRLSFTVACPGFIWMSSLLFKSTIKHQPAFFPCSFNNSFFRHLCFSLSRSQAHTATMFPG